VSKISSDGNGALRGAGHGADGAAGGAAPYPPGSARGYGAVGERPKATQGATGAAGNGARHGAPVDAELVIYRLEEAGATLISLPPGGYSTQLRTGSMEIVRSALESYGWTDKRLRPAVPSAARITRMDEALGWIPLIPRDRYVLRRIVGARALVSPITERHLYAWRRLGALIGADHKAVQRWHAQGIDLIVAALNRGVESPASKSAVVCGS